MSNPSYDENEGGGRRFNPHHAACGFYPPEIVNRESNISASVKLIYWHVVQRAGRNGCCWPAQAAIARDLGLTARQVRNLLGELEDLGLIERRRRGREGPGRGRGSDAIYFLRAALFNRQPASASKAGASGNPFPVEPLQPAIARTFKRKSSVLSSGSPLPTNYKDNHKGNQGSEPDQEECAVEAAAPPCPPKSATCARCRSEGLVAAGPGGFAPVTWCTCPAAVALREKDPARVERFNHDIADLAARISPCDGNRARRAAGG